MKYLPRTIEAEARLLSKHYPVLTITGPRQSGKTTLARQLFGELPYFSFENPDVRSLVMNDPRKFLSQVPRGAILDEVQHVPEIISYLQQIADEKKTKVRFILTGSNHFSVMEQVTQSLAGRTGILKLLPFSLAETGIKSIVKTDVLLYKGFYPAAYTQKIEPAKIYRNYYETYLQKDVRQLIKLKDIHTFDKFIRICAGRTGNMLNASAIANETGISVPTIKSWLSVLEASFVIMLLPPVHENISKRLIKSPKIYFCDTGLAAYLLGISDPEMINLHPLRGALFENMVVMEAVKHFYNTGRDPRLSFFRDSHHNEVDLIAENGRQFTAIEIKSSQTFHINFYKGLDHFATLFQKRTSKRFLIYDGDMEQTGQISVLNFRTFSKQIEQIIP